MDGMVTGALWDLYGEYEQHQAYLSALDCVCELGMSKVSVKVCPINSWDGFSSTTALV